MTFTYHTGGTLPLLSPSYIKRQADDDLYQALLNGEFCYVLTSRQMGKSSLRIQVMNRLEQAGVKCCALDLTGIGYQNITAEQWYCGLMSELVAELQLTEIVDLDEFCEWHENLAPLQRLSKFFETVVLSHIVEPIVVFIDEIDSTISLNFDTDDFFAWIRYCLNLRADRATYQRLTFCLLGVATPTDLIKAASSRTPFNIGKSIEPQSFGEEQLEPLMAGLADRVEDRSRVLSEIYRWTGGQPFLTQQLCVLIQSELARIDAGREVELIDRLVTERMLNNWEFQDQQSHLRTIRDRLLNDDAKVLKRLAIYQRLLQANDLTLAMSKDDFPEIMSLKLTGLVITDRGKLLVYNKIYEWVFNAEWVAQELAKLRPYAGSLELWLAHDRDEQYLLAGESFQQAQQWALNRQLTEEDYQYLTASQKLDTEKVKAEAEAIIRQTKLEAKQITQTAEKEKAEAEETIRQTKIEAEQITQTAKKRAAQFTALGVSGLIGAGIASAVALFNANELKWRTQIELDSVEALNLPENGLDRIKAGVKLGRELKQKVKDEPITRYPTYAPLNSLRQVLPDRHWHETNRFTDGDTAVNGVAASADGNTIVSGSDKTVKVWQRDGSLISTLSGHQEQVNGVAVSADGNTIVSGSGDKTVKVWRRDGSLIATLTGHEKGVTSVAVSADGGTIVSGSEDKTVKVWRQDGSLISTLTGHRAVVTGVAVSKNGKTVVSGSEDKTVKVWRDGALISTLSGHRERVNGVAVSADGNTIVSGSWDRTVKVWRRDGALIATLTGHQAWVNSVLVSADGQTIVSGSEDQMVKIWQRDGSLIATLAGHQAPVNGVAVSADGKTIFSGSGDRSVKVWQRDGTLIATLADRQERVYGVAASADGSTIVSGSGDKSVKVWRRDGSLIATLTGHEKGVTSVAVSADGRTIVSGSWDRTAKVWRQDGSLIATLIGHQGDVTGVAVSADGRTIVSGSGDKTVRVWRRDGSLIATLTGHQDWIPAVAVSADGQTIVSGSGDKDKTVKVWRQDGSLIATLTGHQDWIPSVAVSADGQTIVSGSGDRTVKVWRRDGTLIATLTGHQDVVHGVAVSADGQTIVSGSRDRTVKVWRRDGSLISTLTGHQNWVFGVAVSGDGKTIVSGSGDKSVRIWHFDLDYLLAKGCEQLQNYFHTHPEQNRLEQGEKICLE